MQDYQLITFDTELFGFKVAKILPEKLRPEKLDKILQELQSQQIRLVYWQAASNDEISNQAAKQFGGFLGSKQVTYLLDLVTLDLDKNLLDTSGVEEYTNETPSQELEQLALHAGENSHFATDPKFPKQLLVKLYKRWIENSTNKTVANKVLVVRHRKLIVGLITLGEKNRRGDIGLLGVNQAFRGQQIGTRLLHAAQREFINEGYKYSQIVTRLASVAACRLYEKCGYKIETITNFYHFWLDIEKT